MSDFAPNYDDGRIYYGPVIDRGILGEDDVPETFASKTPYFFVARTGRPLPRAYGGSEEAVPKVSFTKWLFEWHEERGGWLFMGAR